MDINEFIEKCRECKGTEFKHQGRDRKYGLDCAGLVITSAQELNYEIIDLITYSRRPNQDILFEKIEDSGLYEVKKQNIKKGDLLMIKYDGNIQHVAIVTELEPLYIIHAVTGRQVIEHRVDSNLFNKVVRVYRFPQEKIEDDI